MSNNGIGKNPLLDISKVYLEQIVEKKDDSYLEPDMKKRQKNNEKARKELAKGPQMKNPHFEEKQQGWDAVNSLTDVYKNMSKGTDEVDEAMSSYDRNRKRAAQRAADRNAARAAGKTGVVPGVGYVTPNKERETYTDSKGTVRHKSGAKNEEVENIEELHKGRHGQSEKEYQDGRSMAGKMVSGDSKGSGANYSYRAKNTGSNPAGGSEKPQGQARMGSKDRAYLKMQKANLRKEEASMTDKELRLQKQKARIDQMIAMRRKQDLSKAKKSEAPAKAMGEETEDSLRDRRMERGGVDGNNRYDKAPSNKLNTFGKKKPYDGMSALEKVKASIRAKHGQGAIMDTKKK